VRLSFRLLTLFILSSLAETTDVGGSSSPFVVDMEHSFWPGTTTTAALAFVHRCTIRAELLPAPAPAPPVPGLAVAAAASTAAAAAAPAARAPWRLRADDGAKGAIAPADVAAAVAAARSGGLYRLRARVRGAGELLDVYSSTKMCLLLAAELRHDVIIALDGATGALRGIDVRPALPAGFAGCRGAEAAGEDAVRRLLNASGVVFSGARFGVTQVEEAASVPALNAGRGAPFVGQAELKEEDAARMSRSGLPDAAAAQLDEEDKGPEKKAEPPSLIQAYLPYIILAWAGMNVLKQLGGK
jgi:hypothetical protein